MISLVKPERQTDSLGGNRTDLTGLYLSNMASLYSREMMLWATRRPSKPNVYFLSRAKILQNLMRLTGSIYLGMRKWFLIDFY